MIEAYFTKLREIGLRKRCFVLRRCAAEQFRIPEEGLSGPDQTAPIVRFRQITMAVARRLTGMSLPQIGQAFGGRDHTTVLHASRKYCGLVEDVLAEMYDGQSCPVEVEQ
nr:helix-turn-helix domain-containing protein [Bradyrhizobium elkanii]